MVLAFFADKICARLQKLEDDVSHIINSSAETTANRAADLPSIDSIYNGTNNYLFGKLKLYKSPLSEEVT